MLILISILVIVTCYLMYILYELYAIHKQMSYILLLETNAEITTSSRNRILLYHVHACNRLIQRNKEMKRQQELKERELHQILTSLTHDLRTPLTVASGYTQLLMQEGATNELAVKIDTSLQSVNYYLACLTDYNLIQEKKMDLHMEQIHFSQFLIEQFFQYYEEFEQKGVDVQFHVGPNLLINSDRLMIKRIIENIVSNLLKYAKSEVKVHLQSNGNQISFICENDFYGDIKDPNLLRLRFQTMDDARHNKSMGIGLHIIQELTEAIEGVFEIEVQAQYFKTTIQLVRA